MTPHNNNRNRARLLGRIDAAELRRLIVSETKIHGSELRGKSGMGEDWENGFIQGLIHAQRLLRMMRNIPQ